MQFRLKTSTMLAGAMLWLCATQGWAAGANDLIQRGAYVARAGDCMSCHTGPGSPPFAGGDALKTPFGTLYGPNITPDPNFGIGSWSKADFTRAVREGVRKDGAMLYPAMPYMNYTKMTDQDLDALWAYLRSLPPSSHTVPPDSMSFPFNVRTGLVVWNSLYFHPGRFQANASKSADWNRGAYLVQALGHCDACHTPRNIAYSTEPNRYLTGAQIQGWYAPDISNDPLSKISSWNVAQLQRFLKSGHAPGNASAFGPMREAVHDSLSFLSNADLRDIALFLKDQSDQVAPQRAKRLSIAEAEDVRASLSDGKVVYQQYCSSCHQNSGKGIPNEVPALAGNDAVAALEPYDVIMVLLEGIKPHGLGAAMGSFATTLSDAQIADVTNYVRTAWKNDGQPNATAWMVGNWRETASPAHGEPAALACPVLPEDVMQPAVSAGADVLKRAAGNSAGMTHLVGAYTAARPNSSAAQVIEALSAAYCRAVSNEGDSTARMDAKIADFSQQVAVALTQSGAAVTAPR